MDHLTDFLKAHLAQNRTKLVLTILIDFYKGKRPDLQNQCVLHLSNLEQVERDFASGVISRQEAWQSLAKVKMGLIHLIDEAAGLDYDAPQALMQAQAIERQFPKEEEFSVPEKRVSAWVWALGLVVAVAAGAALAFWGLNRPAPESVPAALPAPQPVEPKMTLADTLKLVEAYREEADKLTLQNQMEKALEVCNKAVALRQNDYALYNQRADILFKMTRYTQARGDAERAITLNPNNCWSYMTMAQIQTGLGNSERFYYYIEKALQKHCEVWDYDEQPGILEHRNEARFKRLMRDYR